ncbi:hypothetical protein RHMOL_Rhmol09G0199300 [Rhododendron molle]|uniref:Uncharacterized protein n=1 Tax=Rhododendron molle TaxID=49168 RepID=A0ACC0MF96_RHOML|nr:hypothetical protein RHMOL_Rhmol09G0199300 [Rhododendron molle]
MKWIASSRNRPVDLMSVSARRLKAEREYTEVELVVESRERVFDVSGSDVGVVLVAQALATRRKAASKMQKRFLSGWMRN